MTDEVRYRKLADKGVPITHIKRKDFIKLFVNHRPVYGIGKNNIEEAFTDLLASCNDREGGVGALSRADFLSLLQKEGEEMSFKELESLLVLLVGEGSV